MTYSDYEGESPSNLSSSSEIDDDLESLTDEVSQLPELAICAEYDDPLSSIFTTRPLSEDSSSDGCFAAANSWLKTCLETHGCSQHLSTLPTRVIDVGDERREPHLHISRGECAPWITLSHCWGKSQPIVTTTENLEDHCQLLSFSTLPQTFQDAITITRRLGHQYLWIDSLCIIQDSTEDWEAESTKMASVYYLGLLNIAAEDSSNDNDGIFGGAARRRDHPKLFFKFPCRSRSRSLQGLLQAQSWRSPMGDQISLASPLHKRAWVLQENLLSPRILTYQSSALYWTCDEIGNSEIRPSLGSDSFPRKHHSIQDALKATKDSSHSMKWWYQTVNSYCTRRLTFEKDRLPALGGLASEFARRTGYHYKAGIWLEDFRDGLLWQSKGLEIDTLIAPSWSWASISFRRDEVRRDLFSCYYLHSKSPRKLWAHSRKRQRLYDAELVDISLGTKSGDPFGQIISGILILRGWCQTLPDLSWHDAWKASEQDVDLVAHNHQSSKPHPRGHISAINASKPPPHTLNGGKYPNDLSVSSLPTQGLILSIYITESPEWADARLPDQPRRINNFYDHCLLLHPYGDGTYFRIGQTTTRKHRDEDPDPLENDWKLEVIKIR